MRKTQERQRTFAELGWGGWREGAGRKKSKDSGVSHGKREELKERHPVMVTVRRSTHTAVWPPRQRTPTRGWPWPGLKRWKAVMGRALRR